MLRKCVLLWKVHAVFELDLNLIFSKLPHKLHGTLKRIPQSIDEIKAAGWNSLSPSGAPRVFEQNTVGSTPVFLTLSLLGFWQHLSSLCSPPRPAALQRVQWLHHQCLGRAEGDQGGHPLWSWEPRQHFAGFPRRHGVLLWVLGQHSEGEQGVGVKRRVRWGAFLQLWFTASRDHFCKLRDESHDQRESVICEVDVFPCVTITCFQASAGWAFSQK